MPDDVERLFAIAIDPSAFEHQVQQIGDALSKLNQARLVKSTRDFNAVLTDIRKGIQDGVLLKTRMSAEELEFLLKEHLGANFKFCTIKWV